MQFNQINGEINQPLKKIKLVNYSDKSESDTSLLDQEPKENYNNKTELVKEDVIASNLRYDPEFDEKHDPLTTKSSHTEENANEDQIAAVLKKYECFVCDKKFSVEHIRGKHMRKLHKKACHICGSTFQTVQEITKHIAGNLHNFCINMCPLIPKVLIVLTTKLILKSNVFYINYKESSLDQNSRFKLNV